MADALKPAKKVPKEWMGGIVRWEDYDVPFDVRWFNNFGRLTTLWLWQSRALYENAELVMLSRKNRASTFFNVPTGMMLGSYTIETLLKAAQIAELNERQQEGLFFSDAKDMHSTFHDLNKLVDETGIKVSKKDRTLLSELTEFAIWKGKYPIPLKAKEYRGPALYDALNAHLKGKEPTETWERVSTLYKKLSKKVVRRVEASSPPIAHI